MFVIEIEQFKQLLNSYSVFDEKILNSLIAEFGKTAIDGLFEQYYSSLEETEIAEFLEKYKVYFEKQEQEENTCLDKDSVLNEQFMDKYSSQKALDSIIAELIYTAARFPIMSFDEEKAQGLNLKEGREKLKIIKTNFLNNDDLIGDKKEISLYPRLDLEKIFSSIRTEYDVELLKSIKKLVYSYGDESILRDDIDDIRKYLKLCKNGIPDIPTLKREFTNLSFDNVDSLSSDDFAYQMDLLKRYIIARFNFFNRNLKLVISVAKKVNSGKLPFEDIIQIGNIGLIKALNRFDPEKGYKFSTYSTWWIRQSISREVAETADVIKKPVHIVEKIKRYEVFVSKYVFENEVMPSLHECAEGLGVSISDIIELQKHSTNILSLESPVNNLDGDTDLLLYFIASDDVPLENIVLNKAMFENIIDIMRDCLTEKEFKVLLDRNALNPEGRKKMLEEIGQEFGVTRERVRQIENKALRKIRSRAKSFSNYSD